MGGKAVAAVTKLASERWKEISEAEKRPFQEEAEEKKAQYKKAMETYVPPVVEEEEKGDKEDEEDEEDEEDVEDGEEEEGEASKKRKATSKNVAPAAKKVQTAGSAEVEAE